MTDSLTFRNGREKMCISLFLYNHSSCKVLQVLLCTSLIWTRDALIRWPDRYSNSFCKYYNSLKLFTDCLLKLCERNHWAQKYNHSHLRIVKLHFIVANLDYCGKLCHGRNDTHIHCTFCVYKYQFMCIGKSWLCYEKWERQCFLGLTQGNKDLSVSAATILSHGKNVWPNSFNN